VQNAEIVTYKHNQRSKGFAFVQMLTIEEAKRAVSELHDKEFLGRKLVVSGAKSNDGPDRS
jgi:RNA recognition motif-containing protein